MPRALAISERSGGRAPFSGVARLLLVLERAGNGIGQDGRALADLALLVRRVVDLVVVGGERLDGRLREARAARLRQVAEVQPLDAVAAGADLGVDLEAALQLGIVEVAEDAAEGPVLAVDVHAPRRRPRPPAAPASQGQRQRPHHVFARIVLIMMQLSPR